MRLCDVCCYDYVYYYRVPVWLFRPRIHMIQADIYKIYRRYTINRYMCCLFISEGKKVMNFSGFFFFLLIVTQTVWECFHNNNKVIQIYFCSCLIRLTVVWCCFRQKQFYCCC